MNRVVKIFNQLIEHKLSPQFGEVLLDCKLVERGYGYRYDLLFVFQREYNNRGIQYESILQTCDELFDWVDLRDMGGLSIVIITAGRNEHLSYFELMDEICRSGRNYNSYMISNHPKYREYQEWKSNKMHEDRVKRAWESEMGRVTRNDLIQQTRMVESKKKKFLFW
jgi:hypothetical protein